MFTSLEISITIANMKPLLEQGTHGYLAMHGLTFLLLFFMTYSNHDKG